MDTINPYNASSHIAITRREHHRQDDFQPRFQIAAILHAFEAMLIFAGMVALWNAGDWHEALPWGILGGFLCLVARGLWHGKGRARLLGLIVHWFSAMLCGIALLGCLLILASWPFTGGGIAHGLAVYAAVLSMIAIAFSLATIRSLQITSDES